MKNISTESLKLDLISKKLIPMAFLTALLAESTRFRVFDPATTLYCFIYQVLSRSSCKNVLIHFNSLRHKEKEKLVSMNTSAFTQAIHRLTEDKLKNIAVQIGLENQAKTSKSWLWKGRNVELVDGTVISLEDTKENQESYPVTKSKTKNMGPPKLRLLARFSQSNCSFIDGEIGQFMGKGQSEIGLLQKMIQSIDPGSILVLDRFFTSYFMQSLFVEHGLDYVIRSRDKFAKDHLFTVF